MNSYQKVINELYNCDLLDTLYRFQGGKSFECFDIKNNRFVAEQLGKYAYFSGNKYHHLYFSVRRIRQLINNIILKETNFSLCAKQLYNTDKYKYICKMIENSDKLESIYSIKLLADKNFVNLMKENSFRSDRKPNSDCIERVDRRVYSGGYGIKNEWLELLELTTFFTSYYKMSTDRILDVVNNMRKSGKINSIYNLISLLDESYNIKINSMIFNDFIKYEIVNLLEQIIENGLCNENSELYKSPTIVIKNTVNGFLNTREKTLKLVDENFKDLII